MVYILPICLIFIKAINVCYFCLAEASTKELTIVRLGKKYYVDVFGGTGKALNTTGVAREYCSICTSHSWPSCLIYRIKDRTTNFI